MSNSENETGMVKSRNFSPDKGIQCTTGQKALSPLSPVSPKIKMALLVSFAVVGAIMGLLCAALLLQLFSGAAGRKHGKIPHQKPSVVATGTTPSPAGHSPKPVSSRIAATPEPTREPTPEETPYTTGLPSDTYMAEALEERGIALYREKDYAGAEAEFKKILPADRYYYEAWLYLGRCREKQKDPAGALKAYGAYLRSTPKNPDRLIFIAQLLEEEKEYDRALELYTMALEERADTECFYAIASCYFQEEDYEKAILSLKRGLQVDNKHYPSLLLLGQSYKKSNKQAEALNAFKAAFKREPKNVSLLYEMGELSYEMGQYKNAKAYLDEYMTREGDVDKRNRAFDLLKTVMYRSQKKIPSEVESQNDEIPGMEIMRISRSGSSCSAILSMQGHEEEIAEGQLILNKYYVLDINESRVILKFEDAYYALRPK